MPQLTFSIVINTYNRASYLERLLKSLTHIRNCLFEVIVVNGPSTDDTAALLATYADHIKVVDCRSRNLSTSRNLGITAAAGDIVVFIDDDAFPTDTDWLKRFADAFAGDKSGRLAALGGPVLAGDSERFEFAGGVTSDYGFHRFLTTDTLPDPSQRWFQGVRGCNCAFRRDALRKIGGFDEFFTYYLDETDVCLRLDKAGLTIGYLPENMVRHFSASATYRTSTVDRNWDVITRSDTYFALKNGRDPFAVRLTKTLQFAPRKHFIQEIHTFYRQGTISKIRHAELVQSWRRGLWAGMQAGLTQPRRLGKFDTSPPPFRPFPAVTTEQRLRIALLSQSIPGQAGYGGIARYTYDLACGLHEHGHEIHIFCRSEQPVAHQNLHFTVHGISAAEAAPHPQSDNEHPILERNIRYSSAIVRRLEQLASAGCFFDIVHTSNWDGEGAALLRRNIYPTVMTLVTPLAQVIHQENWELTDDLQACVALDRWQIHQPDTLCLPSQGVLGSYRQMLHVDPEQLPQRRVVPLGIVPDLRAPLPPSQPRRLLFVGRLERRKGAHVLLAILPALLARFPDWECHLVGDDGVTQSDGATMRQRFHAQYAQETWYHRVHFHGFVDEATLRNHYRACDLFVAPSLYESYGLIYHEAMQYGKPVVGCVTGGVPEVVTHEQDGLLVPPDNPAALESALAHLMSNPDLRARLGAAARQRVHEQTNYRTMAAAYEQVFIDTLRRADDGRERQPIRVMQDILMCEDRVQRIGKWKSVVPAANQTHAYLVTSHQNDRLEFTTNGGSIMQIVALRHSLSGLLQILVDGRALEYIDLFQEHGIQYQFQRDIVLPGTANDRLQISLRVHPERNPASYHHEIWLRHLFVPTTIDRSVDQGAMQNEGIE
jgi:glycosyltransferase involved in cell wall biosynthesis/GT2 family glycosyltransferase